MKNGLTEGSICDNNGDFHDSLRAICEKAIDPANGITGVSFDQDLMPIREKEQCCVVKCEKKHPDGHPLTCKTTEQFWLPDESVKTC